MHNNFEYFLEEADINANHYIYYNQLFKLAGDDQLTSKMTADDRRDVENRLEAVSEKIDSKIAQMLEESPYEKMNTEQHEQLILFRYHKNKIALIKDIFVNRNLDDYCYKKLYDLSLGIYHGPEFYSIEKQLGGRAELIKAIEYDKEMNFTKGVFALYLSKCLTPGNFGKLIKDTITSLSNIIWRLNCMNCLTQSNFDLVCRKIDYSYRINEGMRCLEEVSLNNEEYFHYIVQSGAHALTVSQTIKALKSADILNQETLQMALKRKLRPDIEPVLTEMKNNKEQTPIEAAIFMWEGPEEITKLTQLINQMFTHGLFLLTRDFDKGKIAMRLALDLKQYLKQFIELSKEEQAAKLSNFQQSFKIKLHSQDEVMSEHREYWKVIIANILIALTGVGVLVIGANYAINGRYFFAQTKREQLIDNIEYSASVCPALKDKAALSDLFSGVKFVDIAMVNDERKVAAGHPSFTVVKKSKVFPKDDSFAKVLDCLVVKKEGFIFSRKSQRLFHIEDMSFFSDLQRRIYATILRKDYDLFNSRFSKDFWLRPLNYNSTKFSELRYRYACLYDAFESMYSVDKSLSSVELCLFKTENKDLVDIFDHALIKFISSFKNQIILFPTDSHITQPDTNDDVNIVTDIKRGDDGSYTVELEKRFSASQKPKIATTLR